MRALLALALALALAGMARAENLALVISNGYYDHAVTVAEISRQHDRQVAAFERQGYRVFEGKDLGRAGIRRLIEAFARQIGPADVAVVSLSGHFSHFGEASWFLPADINADSATSVAFQAIDMNFIAQILAQKAGSAVLFVGKSAGGALGIPAVADGLATMPMPRGVMMVSGADARVDDILRRKFLRTNTRIIDVLRGDIGALDVEGDIPSGLVLADGRAAVLTPAQIEDSLGLSRRARRQVQQDLTDTGFDTRGVDGVFGRGTRAALKSWQGHNRLARTGFLTADQITTLRGQGAAARGRIEANDRRYWAATGANGGAGNLRQYLGRYPDGVYANQARADLARLSAQTDEQAWAQATRTDTEAAYRRYLQNFPRGIYKDFALARIGAAPQNVDNQAKRVEDSLRLNPVSRLLIEQRVADLGYRTGPRDGNFDLATRQAFRGYQHDRGMAETGYVTADMIRRLLLGQ